ncbi:MAG: flavin reductase family protein [Ardenticatenaceae bacterium]|nr:flavin reductase family protein [Ardenticatenaceae bacterium]
MIVVPRTVSEKDSYRLLIGTLLPRPIAWVSSMNRAGNLNLAPFSYFTVASNRPMTLLFCPQPLSEAGEKKDTLRNVEEVPEFVINLANEETAEAMNRSSTPLPPGHSEFEWAGVTPAPSVTIRVPRVLEAPVSFECTLQQIVKAGDTPGAGSVVFGEVQCIHMRDDIYVNGYVRLDALKPIARLAGISYTRITETFDMARPPLPDELRHDI